ncbi:coiled-coil domain-containing protein 177 [Bactrocera oleae]|uniref:coiled-coil domain-containing protein 177 n=1 Tax=Bactrocera oleae TaxID=104688 RepID=UPI00387E556C
MPKCQVESKNKGSVGEQLCKAMHGRATTRATAAEQHWRLLAELDSLNLSDSCCEICHCDCYSSHRSSLNTEPLNCGEHFEKIDNKCKNEGLERDVHALEQLEVSAIQNTRPTEVTRSTTSIEQNICKKRSMRKSRAARRKNNTVTTSNGNLTKPSSTQATSTITLKSKSAKNTPTHSARTSPAAAAHYKNGAVPKRNAAASVKRSKSVCSLRSRSPTPLITTSVGPAAKRAAYYTRDCKILQELLSALNDDEDDDAMTSLQVNGVSALKQTLATVEHADTSTLQHSHTLPRCAVKSKSNQQASDETQLSSSLTSQKLCASMASLCLVPTVRAAYQQVPAHDRRILNRMVHKRTERAIAKENAWLARKYWENERYERELFKCAQMEEYKRAIRDKQFQDYLLTKARLNEIAQRDLSELRRLREALQQKDMSTKRRLDALKVERGIAACQRRCEELRRAEAVAVQQEEQQIDEKLRKQEICERLSERLQRAELIRANMLDSYLRRLRYDNHMEELVHEEHWRDAQQLERQRLAQLEEHIQQKCEQSQRFIEERQRRQEAIAKTAKISASLRELVRNSVTPEGGMAADSGNIGEAVSIANTATLSKVLLDRPFSKLSLQP